MTQGNPFGNKASPWMTTTKLRALFNAGLTFDEIAEINERSEGWRPSRSAVSKKYKEMGMPSRRASHKNLIPWKIKPEHNNDELRHMLQAEGRARQGKTLSEADQSLTSRLHNLLFGRGQLMVVNYHPEVGFGLVIRQEYDEDIIREPRADRYADPGIGAEPKRPARARRPAPKPNENDAEVVVA